MAAGALARDRNGSAADVEEGYRGPQVCSIVGITYRQLDYWARTGLLHPSISEATGSGSQRRYSYTDLVQLKVIKRLLDAGLSLQAARKAIACLRSSGDDLATANLVIDDGRSVLAYSGEEIIDLLQGGQTVLNIVPLGRVMSELETAITDLGLPPPDTGAGSHAGEPAAGKGSGPGTEARRPAASPRAGATSHGGRRRAVGAR
jgi:DNA-binding transcriptional MerR regulator